MKNLKVVELFAGIGSPRKALNNLGIQHESMFSEWNVHAINSYTKIYGHYNCETNLTKIELIDYINKNNITLSTNGSKPCQISRLPLNTLANIVNNHMSGHYIGDMLEVKTKKIDGMDVVVGGFPCQDISTAGKQGGIVEGETRSGLMFDMLDFVLLNQPKIVIAENVKNILSKKHKPQLDIYISTLEKAGYKVSYECLNSSEFGVPQARERVIIIAVKKGSFEFSNLEKIPMKKLKDILKHSSEDLFLTDKQQTYAFDKNDVAFKSGRNINKRIINPQITKTISCRGAVDQRADITNFVLEENGEVITKEVTVEEIKTQEHNYKIRKLHQIECLELMGFEECDYNKMAEVTTKSNIYKQAGNSIVVGVMQSILQECYGRHL